MSTPAAAAAAAADAKLIGPPRPTPEQQAYIDSFTQFTAGPKKTHGTSAMAEAAKHATPASAELAAFLDKRPLT
jgi:hypothetical protein